MPPHADMNPHALPEKIRDWAGELGFDDVGVSSTELGDHEAHLMRWLDRGMHGEMRFMSEHGVMRSRPQDLRPGTISIISVRMNYLPPGGMRVAEDTLADPDQAYIARYAVGRDYHKMIRKRLQKLADRIVGEVGQFGYRAFADSAPVLEKAIAERAGLGWIGKHTLNLNQGSGSWYFLGELYTDLPLPPSEPAQNHCGRCTRCIEVCPTRAIVKPYSLDANLCIAYLTIEHLSSIPVDLRPHIGNRIFGCDDCQLVCPWNRFATVSANPDFRPLKELDGASLCELFMWDEARFLSTFEGSAIRRLGHVRWLRNLAVALGNAPSDPRTLETLRSRSDHPSALVREHVEWGIGEQLRKADAKRRATSDSA